MMHFGGGIVERVMGVSVRLTMEIGRLLMCLRWGYGFWSSSASGSYALISLYSWLI